MTVSYAEAMRKRQPTQQQELSTPAQHINPKRTSTNPWGTRVGTANLPVSADVDRMQNIPAQEKDSAWTTIAKSNPIKKQPIAILSRSNKAENPSTGSGKMSLASTATKAKATNNKNRPSNKPKPTLRNMSINDLIATPSKKIRLKGTRTKPPKQNYRQPRQPRFRETYKLIQQPTFLHLPQLLHRYLQRNMLR